MTSFRCPACRTSVYIESLGCPTCGREIAYQPDSAAFFPLDGGTVVIDGKTWYPCGNRHWQCNWLAPADGGSGLCFSCRLTRRRPENDDTLALERLADAGTDKRRLIAQLLELRLPITPFHEQEGGLAFDLLSSHSGENVIIGHANGVITIDLAESLDAHRESLRVRLGEAYRTMLGHFRHEVGHYYQNILCSDEEKWAECRELFGDERASYQDSIARHYRLGAPEDWAKAHISEYATMHPWEDFAETFAHYLHITGTLSTAAAAGVELRESGVGGTREIEPTGVYREPTIDRLLDDWHWASFMFNKVNRSMGARDLYPFDLVEPVTRKLAFVHRLVLAADTRPDV